ncbi:hypothetical protein [Desulfocicer niacini]
MTFRTGKEAFVWIWLPGETEPVVAGRLEADNGYLMFNYGKSYLERVNAGKPAISIYEPELPLRTGLLPLLEGLTMPGCIRDAAPDAWGRLISTNISNPALTDGLEWNVKLCQQGSEHLWKKINATFETYLQSREFERISVESLPRLARALNQERGGGVLSCAFGKHA